MRSLRPSRRVPALLLGLATLSFFACAAPARALIYLDNLDASSTGDATVSQVTWVAAAFTTDYSAPGFTLDSVVLSLGSAGVANGGFKVSLYADNGSGLPGSLLAAGFGPVNPAAPDEYGYIFFSYPLQPDTTYWVAASVTGASSSYNWPMVSDSFTGSWTSITGPVISSNQGDTWETLGLGLYQQFAVLATPVPEPSSCAALLGLPAFAFAAYFRRRPAPAAPRA